MIGEVESVVSGASEPLCPEINLQELQKSIQCLKNTSPGNDLIANAFLTSSPDCIKIELLNLFNTSFVSGVVPASWKQGVICALLKPGKDPTKVGSIYCHLPILDTDIQTWQVRHGCFGGANTHH